MRKIAQIFVAFLEKLNFESRRYAKMGCRPSSAVLYFGRLRQFSFSAVADCLALTKFDRRPKLRWLSNVSSKTDKNVFLGCF